MASKTPLHLRVSNNKAYLWDVDDIAVVRNVHRICGVLSGTLPHLSQQNVFLGVPLVLLAEEVVLLVENEAAVLVDDPKAHSDPSPSDLQRWSAREKSLAEQQINQASQVQKDSTTLSMSDAALKKRKDREAKRAAAAEAGAADPLMSITSEVAPSSAVAAQPAGSSPSANDSQYTVVIPADSTEFEWYNDKHSVFTTIEAAKGAGIWEYPSTLYERAKCGVFRGLWEQGLYMGLGIKFGGDYLVYPGDPLRYHAHFSATVLESPTTALTPMEIVAHGRLGTVTKKSHLLCGWDDEIKECTYLSIEWAGFG